MKIALSLSASAQVYYHGSDTLKDPTSYDFSKPNANRGTNVAGMYLTPREYEAASFGKHVHRFTINVSKPFLNRKSSIDAAMQREFVKVLLKETHYKQDWILEHLLPEFIETSRLPDISGLGKQQIILAGGYDSFLDGGHIAVFNPKKDVNPI